MRSSHLFPLLGGLCVGLICLFVADRIQLDAYAERQNQVKTVAEERVQKLAAALSKSMNVRLNLTSSLAAFVSINSEFTQKEFNTFATLLEKDLPGILSLQLAPNGIVSYLTNLQRNKKALGHDLFADLKRRPLVEQSVRDRSYIIAGPITLIQGGQAVIARRALFFTDEATGKEKFWGFATILIDLAILLRDAGIEEIEKTLRLSIRGKDGLGAKGDVFYGDASIFDTPTSTSMVSLPHSSWQIGAIKRPSPLPDTILFSNWYWAFITATALFLTAIVYSVLRRPEQLKSQVKLATESLQITLNSIAEAVIATDISGNITRMNPVAEKLTNWTLNDALGEKLIDVVKIEDPENSGRTFKLEDIINDPSGLSGLSTNTSLLTKGGKKYQVALSSAPIKDDNGTIKGQVLILRDVSEANILQQELLESKERFEVFANIGADWLWEMDENLRFSFFSDKIHRVTGRPTSDYIGKTRQQLRANKDEDDWYSHLEDLDNRRPFKDFRYKLIEKDGRQFHWSISGKPLFDQNGKFLGYRGTGADITERVLLEEQLRRSNRMDAVDKLTGGIAHDFNNILGIAMGNLELLEESVGEDKVQQKMIKSALKAIKRGSEITRKLLGFSQSGTNTISLTVINPFIENLKDLIAKSLTASIRVELQLSEKLWNVAIDPGDLEDTLVNLSLNARDAMLSGGTLVLGTENRIIEEDFVRQHPNSIAGEYVVISVRDTGTGMQDTVMDRILEPFFTTKEQGKGTGLGLSMVYGFVQRSGGYLDIASEVDEGTTVKIYLPRVDEKHSSGRNSTEIPQPLPRGSETILIVDDEEGMRDIAMSYLQSLGYKTLTAEDGHVALEILENHTDIDLVFSDIVMPGGIDGYQLASEVHNKYPHIAILLTSGFTRKQPDIIQGDNTYLIKINNELISKPYSLSDLAVSIRKSIKDIIDAPN